MQAPTDDNSIVLVRAAPVPGETARGLHDAADALRDCSGEVVVFFHGAGIEHATAAHLHDWQTLAGPSRLKLEVCSAAWQRRHTGTPSAPFELSSLVRFWHRVARGDRVAGGGLDESGKASPSGRWVVQIDSGPAHPNSREMLEMVLAGASLELPITVLFSGDGRLHLVGEQACHWRQLVDFELARLCVLDDGDVEPELPVVTLDNEALDRLRERSAGLFLL